MNTQHFLQTNLLFKNTVVRVAGFSTYTNGKMCVHPQSGLLFFILIVNINLGLCLDIWTSITKEPTEWPSSERGSVLFNKDKMFQWKEFAIYFSFPPVCDQECRRDKLSESLGHGGKSKLPEPRQNK